MHRIAVLAASCLALLLGAPSATAAIPFDVGTGDAPDIAVDASGRAHLAFLGTTGTPDLASYCQVPRGGGACVEVESFGPDPADPAAAFGRAHVFVPTAGEVVVAYERCCNGDPSEGTRSLRSLDGGISFGSRTVFGEFVTGSLDEAVYGPNATITGLAETVTAGTQVLNGAVAGPKQAGVADLLDAIGGKGAIGLETDGSPVAVFENITPDPTQLLWRKLTDGVALTSPNINNQANWTPSQLISNTRTNAASGPALAGGPNGLFLFWQQRSPDTGYVMKFTGTGFTAPVTISDGQPFNDFDLHQDPAGRLHAVWNAHSDDELRYTFSDDGVTWSPVVDLARGEDSYSGVRVAAAADHQGFAVWRGSASTVRAVPLEALPSDAPADTTDPAISDASIGDSTLVPGQGTTFSFTSSEGGTAKLVFQKQGKGLKLKKGARLKCFTSTKKRLKKLRKLLAKKPAVKTLRGKARRRKLAKLVKKRRCKPFKTIGSITQVVTPGRNEIVFTGRIAGRKLSPGTYRAVLTVRDLAGNVSTEQVFKFKVIGKRKKGGR